MAIRPRLPEFPDLPGLAAGLAKAVYESQVEQPLGDMYWSLTNPIDRIAGRGRAANPILGYPLGGRYAPRTPGLRAETLRMDEPTVNFSGIREPAYVTPGERAYNLLNEQNEIVATANRQKFPKGNREALGLPPADVHVGGMWVRPDYRNTTAMFDLYNILSRGGKETLSASFANRRLEKVFNKRMARKNKPTEKPAKKETAMDIVNNTPSGANARQLALALEMERRGEIAARRLPLDPRVESFQPIAASGRRARPGPTKFNPRRRSGV